MKHPALSVLIPNYNHAGFLPTCLDAILDQSFRPAEIIIIDDASTDHSVEIIETYTRKDRRIRLIQNKHNMGIAYNQNKFPEIARGDYLVGCAADDRVLPGFFEKSVNLLEQYPKAGLCSALSITIDIQGHSKEAGRRWLPRTSPGFITPREALCLLQKHGSWMSGNAVIYRLQALIDAGGFMRELESYTDGFIQEVIALRYGSCFIPEPLAAWRSLENNYSATYMGNVERELAILDLANKLKQTTYRDIFPPEYIEVATRRWMYSFGISDLNRFESQQQYYLQLLCRRLSFLKPSLLDRLVLGGWQLSIRLQRLIIDLFLTFRFYSLLAVLKRLLRWSVNRLWDSAIVLQKKD